MKKNRTKIISIILIAIGVSNCSEEYFNVNTPSATVAVEELGMSDLLAPIIHSTMEGQRSGELAFGNYVQNFVSRGGGAAGETQATALWNQVYLFILPNLKVIKQKAVEENAPHYGAVADILTAINLGIATDTWDNIPFSQASLGQDNLSPTFDTQEQIYKNIFALLDDAIKALQDTDDSGIFVGKEDLIYGGDLDKWLRSAYTLKARYQLHLVKKGVMPSTVLASIANGFDSNGDNFVMSYNERNINPWYSGEILSRNTGNFHHDIASQLVSSMNGDYYPFAGTLTIDPRLPLFASKGDSIHWKGFVSGGKGLAPDGSHATTLFAENGFYTSINSPLVLITYAEAMFIKAEAAFLANSGTPSSVGSTPEAYTAYMDGVRASMEMYKVDAAAYVADAAVDVGQASLMLHHIMKEKYIHNFLNPETFVDYRRYNFSDKVFKGLTIRTEEDSKADFAGEWFRRATYPSRELNRNREVVEVNQQLPTIPVWWNQ